MQMYEIAQLSELFDEFGKGWIVLAVRVPFGMKAGELRQAMAKQLSPPLNDPCPEHWLDKDGIPCQLEKAHRGMHYHKGPVTIGSRTLVIELWWNFGQAILHGERE